MWDSVHGIFNLFYIVSERAAIVIAFGFRYLMSLRFVRNDKLLANEKLQPYIFQAIFKC
jgi:hypothetical protein